MAALRTHPSAAGTMTIKMAVGGSGVVASAKVETSTLDDSEMAACVERTFAKIAFPPPSPKGTVPVTYTLSFEMSDGSGP